jgi:ribosomal protein S18 acetylase RimI-like enzyme
MFKLQQTFHQHLNKVVACHLACFPDSLSTKIGSEYTKRTLEWFLIQDNRFLFHIENEDRVIGYCGGFRSAYPGDGSTSGMLQHAMREAIKGIIKRPYLIFHAELIKRYPLIAKNIFRKILGTEKNRSINSDNIIQHPKIGLVVIGVHPDYRGKGYFELLMQHFEEECKKRNIDTITLSVKSSNERAIAAYKKTGWQIASQKGKSINMFKTLSTR